MHILICLFILMLVGKEKERDSYQERNEIIRLGNEIVIF